MMITTSPNAKEGDWILRYDQDRGAVVLVSPNDIIYDAISKASDKDDESAFTGDMPAEYVLGGVTLQYLDREAYNMAVKFCAPAMTIELATNAMWRQYTILRVSTAKAGKTRALFEAVDAVLGGQDV